MQNNSNINVTSDIETDKELFSQFESISISHSILSRIPYNISIEYFILPYSVDDKGRIEVLMAYPHDAEMIQAMQLYTGVCVKPTEMGKDYLLRLIAKHYDVLKAEEEEGIIFLFVYFY